MGYCDYKSILCNSENYFFSIQPTKALNTHNGNSATPTCFGVHAPPTKSLVATLYLKSSSCVHSQASTQGPSPKLDRFH